MSAWEQVLAELRSQREEIAQLNTKLERILSAQAGAATAAGEAVVKALNSVAATATTKARSKAPAQKS